MSPSRHRAPRTETLRDLVTAFLPMEMCGIALAGASLPAATDGTREGIATAEELSALDLSGCELVTLSACDTNVGVIRASQGIASLQQAIYAAGARADWAAWVLVGNPR